MTHRRKPESGFALLLVFAMASVIAIALYYSMPRVAFEAQRDKEQTLIDRGEQYQRAIQLFVRKNKKWPGKIEELENTNSVRFLRRRYVDPMTGKDEWRAVHVGPTGVLTDSLIKPLDKDKKEGGVNNFITELQPLGGVNDPQGAVNPALRKRPSDQAPTGGGVPGDPTAPGASNGQTDAGLIAGNVGPNGNPNPNNNPNVNGNMNPNGSINPNGQQLPGNYQPGQIGLPPQLQPPGTGRPNPVNPAGGNSGGVSVFGGLGASQPAQGYSTAPGANGSTPPPGSTQNAGQSIGGPGQVPGQGQNSAASLIQGLLTSPRPGGAPPGVGGAQAGQAMGSGIAGFASKHEGSAIKIYRDQDEYQKWEFVYDMKKDASITGGQGAIPQVAGPGGTPIGQTAGQTPGQTTGQSSFGQSSFGQSSNQSTGQTGAGTSTPVKP